MPLVGFDLVFARLEELIRAQESLGLTIVPTIHDVVSMAQDLSLNLIRFLTPDSVDPMINSLTRNGFLDLAQQWE